MRTSDPFRSALAALLAGCVLFAGAACRRTAPAPDRSAAASASEQTSAAPPPEERGISGSSRPSGGTASPGVVTGAGDPASPGPAASASAAASAPLVLLAGGDVNLGREAGQAILRDPGYDALGDIAPLLRTADLRFVNLECQLSDQRGETQSPTQRLKFTGPPGGAEALLNARIDVVSLANNHLWDYGRRAFHETLENLERVGVAYVGASAVPGKQYEPTVLRVKGWSVAFFAVTHIWNHGPLERHPAKDHVAGANFARLEPLLRAARREHDLVLLSYHGGGEYVEQPMTWTRDFVRAVMATGVDAVLGHHPHVPQGVGWFGERPVFYSLGNLVFAMHSDHPWTGTSFLARLTFQRGAPPRVEACPYHILGHRPQLFEGRSRAARERQLLAHLRRISLGVGGTELGEPGEHSCFELRPPRPKR